MQSTTVQRCWLKAEVLPPAIEADFKNTVGKSHMKATKQDMDMLTKDISNLVLEAKIVSSESPDTSRDASEISTLNLHIVRSFFQSTTPDVQEVMEIEALEEFEAFLTSNGGGTLIQDELQEREVVCQPNAPYLQEVPTGCATLEVAAAALM